MDKNIKKRFSVLEGYDHERDGVPIPQPKLYEYTLLIDDIVMDHGYIQASSEEMFEKRFKKEVYPYKTFDHLVYKESFCNCGSDNDVTDFWVGERIYIKCRECRFKEMKR